MIVRRTLQTALAVLVAVVAITVGSAAGAIENPDYTAPPPATPVSVVPVKVDAIRVQPAVTADLNTRVAEPAAANQQLAITGSETMQLVALGALLVAGGAGLMVVRRRTTA